MSEDKETRLITVEGRVQGVGYRAYVQLVARKLKINGRIRNLMDGRVEMAATGSKETLDQFIEHCRKGPGFADIANLTQQKLEETTEFKGFRIVS